MKKLIFILFVCVINISAQEFLVNNLSGEVKILRGTEESYRNVKKGDILLGTDLLITENNSFVQLNKDGDIFLLKSNSALGLNYIKNISINDLLLQLAMEEVRNLPFKRKNGDGRNTAVYGSEIGDEKTTEADSDNIGIKKLNGAEQLAENGYKESAIIVAKETYRNYPYTKSLYERRLYFALLLEELELFEEAIEEYSRIKGLKPPEDTIKFIDKKIEELNLKIVIN